MVEFAEARETALLAVAALGYACETRIADRFYLLSRRRVWQPRSAAAPVA